MGFFRLRENFQCYSQNWVPQTCHIFSSFNLVLVAKRLACVRFYFQYQGYTYTPTYMMTCTYNFLWSHIYVKCPITSGSHILDPQNPIFSFRHNFTKKYFFSKFRLFPNSARSDISKEPITSGYLRKNAKIKISRENRSQASGQLYTITWNIELHWRIFDTSGETHAPVTNDTYSS